MTFDDTAIKLAATKHLLNNLKTKVYTTMNKNFYLKKLPFAICATILLNSQVHADDTVLPAVNVQSKGVEERLSNTGRLKDDVVQTEVVSKHDMEKKQAGSIAQTIQNEPGVRVSTECSMCGVKRIMLNGLKGEHTTLMIDGVPNSSMLEGFYGFDALPTAGISSVEISRGAGAALIAPEAIGGVVNVITEKPLKDELEIDLSQGTEGYRKYQLVGKKLSKDGRTRALIAGQTDNIDQYDQDDNWINEAPKLENRSIMAKIWHDFTPNDAVSFRIADQQSEVFGGPMLGKYTQSKPDAASQAPGSGADFIGGDVGNRPDTSSSTPRDWLENIKSTKQEYTAKWIHEINSDWNTVLTGSHVHSTMDAIYEGVTYYADQEIYYFDAKANYSATDKHFLTFGIDYKLDTTDTDGTTWNSGNKTWEAKSPNDAYRNNNIALYVRDVWTPSANLEVAAALRADKIDVDFVDQDRKFDETLLAPRLHVRYDHSLNWTSRLSLGQGYRVPLQFFESEHGIIDQGFAVDVDKIEKSNSARYSLSFTGVKSDVTASISTTEVQNLSTLEEINGVPTLVSTDFTSVVNHADISGNYTFGKHNHWSINGTIEAFQYDKNYRSTFSVIPVEERIRLGLDYNGHGWEGNLSATWIGSRDYKDYPDSGYDKHYDDAALTKLKGSSSPDYYTVDAKLGKEITKSFSVYAGVNNLFDYTQTSEGNSPLYYEDDGEGGAAWDVVHLWGPLRGRVIYGGIKATF